MSDTNPPEDPQAETAAAELSPAARILQLQQLHQQLDAEIDALYEYPYRDQLHLQRLKRQKLRLKDDIERLKGDLIPDLNA